MADDPFEPFKRTGVRIQELAKLFPRLGSRQFRRSARRATEHQALYTWSVLMIIGSLQLCHWTIGEQRAFDLFPIRWVIEAGEVVALLRLGRVIGDGK